MNMASSLPSDSRFEARQRDHELKVINDRIALIDKHFAVLSDNMLSYNSALESIYDKGSRLSSSLNAYAEQELPSVRNALLQTSECIATVQDYRGAEISFNQTKVAQPLALYATNCKHAREYTRETTTSREKELAKLKVVEKMRSKDPNNTSKLLEQELHKATVDSGKAREIMVDQMITLEKKKIEDIKKTLGDFCHGQLLFHAKALEIFTHAYQSLLMINEEEDLEAFENLLHPATLPARRPSRTNSQTSFQGSQLSLNGTN